MKRSKRRIARQTAAGLLALSVLCTAAIPGMLALPAGAAAAASGDLNGDESVTGADVAILQQYLLQSASLTADQAASADVVADGVLNGLDLARLRQMAQSTLPDEDDVVTSLVYSGSSVTATNASGSVVSNPSNLTISGANVTVTASSEISVSGESTSGQLAVNVDKTAEPAGKVVLNLEGLTLSNSTAAPIYVEAIGDEVQISAKNGTTNTISDGTSHTDSYVDSDGNTNPVNGAIFSRDDLKLKGKGTLIVNGNTEDGIVCKNDLKIWNGNITVNAADDGIRGNDSVRIGDPDATDYSTLSVTVNTNNSTFGGDGIKTNSDEDGKGYITMSGGTVN
ncbi:carbohydrate-binding domain-containing protein, partial [uncultured Ruminococcus sp.]